MGLSTEARDLCQVLIRISGSLSVLGCLIAIISYCGVKEYRTPSNRMVVFMFMNDLLASAAASLGQLGYTAFGGLPDIWHPTTFCMLQGTLIQLGFTGSIMYSGTKSLNLLLKYKFRLTLEDMEKIEKWYHLGIFLFTWLPAFVFNFVSDPALGAVYGNSTFWCWVTGPWSSLRMIFFYGPMWVVWIMNICIYIYIVSKVALTKKAIMNLLLSRSTRVKETKSTINVTSEQEQQMSIYIRNSMIYLASFIFTWIWGSANRIQNMADPTNPIPILFYLHSFFTPLQGFTNFIVYSLTTMKWWTYLSFMRGKKDRRTENKFSSLGVSKIASAAPYSAFGIPSVTIKESSNVGDTNGIR